MGHRRGFVRIFFVLAAFGIFSTIGMLGRPTLASVRPVEVVHLIGTGMCFGGAILALIMYLRTPERP